MAWKNLVKNPNRVAAYLTAGAALLGGLAPVVADLDLTSTVGILGGVGAVVAVFREWLKGWQKLEAAEMQAVLLQRQADAEAALVAAAGQPPQSPRVSLPR